LRRWTDIRSPQALAGGLLAAAWQPAISVVLSVAVIVGLFPALFALTVLLERKGLGRIQNRIGPNAWAPLEFLQRSDGIKSLTKEDIVPPGAMGGAFLAPVVLVSPSSWALRCCHGAQHDAGQHGCSLCLLCHRRIHGVVGVHGRLSSRNKYSLLGAMRAVAQMISYEVPLLLSSVAWS